MVMEGGLARRWTVVDLPGTLGAEKSEDVAAVYGEADIIYRRLGARDFGQILDYDHRETVQGRGMKNGASAFQVPTENFSKM